MDFEKARRIMVDSQVRVNDVTEPAIVAAFLYTPRENFVPKSMQDIAYSEHEMEMSDSRAMWTPRDLGKMLKYLNIKHTDAALVIGAGAGYSSALISKLSEAVIALEDEDESVERLTERFAATTLDNAVAVKGDLAAGMASQGPFDIILINGMVETVPQSWLDQLSEGGRLGVVVRQTSKLGTARIYTRAGETVSSRDVFECCPPVLPGFEMETSFVF